jgi:hypothetical protein
VNPAETPDQLLKYAFPTDWDSITKSAQNRQSLVVIELANGTPFIHRLIAGQFEVDGISPQHIALQDFQGGEPFTTSLEAFRASRPLGEPYVVLPTQEEGAAAFTNLVDFLRPHRADTKKSLG